MIPNTHKKRHVYVFIQADFCWQSRVKRWYNNATECIAIWKEANKNVNCSNIETNLHLYQCHIYHSSASALKTWEQCKFLPLFLQVDSSLGSHPALALTCLLHDSPVKLTQYYRVSTDVEFSVEILEWEVIVQLMYNLSKDIAKIYTYPVQKFWSRIFFMADFI